ncbi:MAG TPA: helix-turn-helix domain-containing protein [Ktedonobacterales bacterium]|nr:helix-turn-helix domain-containing protein [Ktedonobacterales bacterium]
MSTTDTSTTTQRAMRADARQNYEKLVKAATDAFAEHGSDAALDDIARRAGVGIGTLYRHFPTRQELIEATFCDQMDTLVAQAEELLKHPNPAEAFDIWLHALLTQSRVCRCLAASVTIALLDENSAVSAAGKAKSKAAAALLERAQQAGVVRSDITSADVGRLVHGIALATEKLPDGAEQADRLLGLVLDSLWTRRPDTQPAL